MDVFTLEPEAQERISVEELASLIFRILKRNLSAKGRIVSYYEGSLSAINGFELLRGPGNREVKRHPSFDKKFVQAVQVLRDKGLIMQDHTQMHSPDFVELTEKGEKTEPDGFFPLVDSADKLISELDTSVGSIDRVAEVYLRESLDTLKSDFLISSAFCLGAMSERVVLLLAKKIESDLKDPDVSKAYSKCNSVKHHAKFISDNIGKLRKNHPGNDMLFMELDTKVNTLAGYYRMTRNEAGHPDFVPTIGRPELELALKTVPKYLETILSVTKLLA
jgi:hypothetical protein